VVIQISTRRIEIIIRPQAIPEHEKDRRSIPGSTPPTSQLDWLISTTKEALLRRIAIN
jgi:hypothetical protein